MAGLDEAEPPRTQWVEQLSFDARGHCRCRWRSPEKSDLNGSPLCVSTAHFPIDRALRKSAFSIPMRDRMRGASSRSAQLSSDTLQSPALESCVSTKRCARVGGYTLYRTSMLARDVRRRRRARCFGYFEIGNCCCDIGRNPVVSPPLRAINSRSVARSASINSMLS